MDINAVGDRAGDLLSYLTMVAIEQVHSRVADAIIAARARVFRGDKNEVGGIRKKNHARAI